MASILLIEDSTMVQKVVDRLLSRKGHEVRIAGTVREAVNGLKEGAYGLILMDLNLPDARGEAAVSFLRDVMEIKTPVIVISSEIKADTVVELQPYGISAYVAKSEDFVQRLSEEVDKVLSG